MADILKKARIGLKISTRTDMALTRNKGVTFVNGFFALS